MQNVSIVRIIVANRNKLIKEGLIHLLNNIPEFVVIDEAEDGNELVCKCKRNPPDLILIDSQLKECDAFYAVKSIRENFCRLKIIVIVDREYNESTIIGKRKFVNGLITNDICRAELEMAIQKVMLGEYFLDRRLRRQRIPEKEPETNQPRYMEPTQRENEIIYLLSKGLSSQEISEKLFISIKTVSSHRSKLIKKYNLKSSTELLHFAHIHCQQDDNGNGKDKEH